MNECADVLGRGYCNTDGMMGEGEDSSKDNQNNIDGMMGEGADSSTDNRN